MNSKYTFKRMLLSLMLVTTTVWFTHAQDTPTDKTAYYTAGKYEYADITLPYRQLMLNQEKSGKNILVVQLHGGTARGTDNVAQLEASAVDSVERYLQEHGIKACFVLPQCASDRVWNESRRTYTVTMTDVLTHWLEEFIASNNVDAEQVFITGYSAGGSGAWRMANDNPGMFAAACIAAANPVMVEAAKVKDTPIYAIAGANDAIMDANKIEDFVNQLVQLGDDARFDLLPNKDHFGTCDTAFTNDRLTWTLSHPAAEHNPIRGDLTGDGKVDIADVNEIINIILTQ